jgi:starch-binding outer membrane protein, SusD/RagB family
MTIIFRCIQKFSLRLYKGLLMAALLFLITLTGCKKYLDVPLPINAIAGSAAYANDNSAAASLNSVYGGLYNQGDFDGTGGVGFLTGVYGDEFRNFSINVSFQALYSDVVSSTTGGVTGIWTNLYKQLYSVNLGIESLQSGSGLSYKDQWLGEAYFLRGLLYFYLTNLYGDVPLVLSSDYLKNNVLPRSHQADVYKQIISDLKQAQGLLDGQYHDASGAVTLDRGRPDRMAATALLARVYLYTRDWPNAESQADSLIANSTYQLPTPDKTFLIGSPEIIWGLEPTQSSVYPYEVRDAPTYHLPAGTTPLSTGVPVTLSDSLRLAFEAGDNRYTNWVGVDSVPASGATPATVYYYAFKYKAIGTFSSAPESIVLLRLGEQYLIRAEARAQQNKLTGGDGAIPDLNVIRTRAGLSPTAAASQTDVLNAIQKERRIELFAENGNRFFDLRRTGALDPLMTTLAPLKGGSWASFKDWWPIPLSDIQNNLSLTQTPGYQ